MSSGTAIPFDEHEVRRVVREELLAARDAVLTVEDVVVLLRLGRNAVYDACARGEIPHRRVGKRLLFSRAAILRWLAHETNNPGGTNASTTR